MRRLILATVISALPLGVALTLALGVVRAGATRLADRTGGGK